MNRMYITLDVKGVEDDKRIITGVATTPTPDRLGDIVEPLGVQFKNPMPLLWQHDSKKPVGTVTFDKPTKSGITFTAKLADIREPGTLKDRVDEAWQSVKAGLVRAVSIGFNALEYSFIEGTGGIRFLVSEVMELSLVTIPANAEATISEIKSIDSVIRAAAGIKDGEGRPTLLPGASGKTVNINSRPKEGKMTLAEQIAALEAKRASLAAQMEGVQSKAAEEGRTKTAEERTEFTTFRDEIKQIDEELVDLRDLEKAKITHAKGVETRTEKQNSQQGSGDRQFGTVKVTEKKVPGLAFARIVKCLGQAGGNHMQAFEIAKARYSNSPLVVGALKAAVEAGGTISGNWAEALVGDETSAYADFVEFLRPTTIVGKFGTNGIPALRNVPFRVPLLAETIGMDGYWVGEGKPKPLTKGGFARTTLEPLKVANIAVLTRELIRDSAPSAEMLVRDSLAAALRERIDIDFIDPAKAAAAGVSPASITNGVSAIASTGNDADAIRADIRALLATFIAANNTPTNAVFIMSSMTALALSQMRNPLGQAEFGGISMLGGTLEGIPVITSEYLQAVTAGGFVVLANASDIYFADNGDISIEMSTQASLQMNDAPPTQDAMTGTGIAMVSMFQTNSVAFLAERALNWKKRRVSAVAVLDEVNWGDPTS